MKRFLHGAVVVVWGLSLGGCGDFSGRHSNDDRGDDNIADDRGGGRDAPAPAPEPSPSPSPSASPDASDRDDRITNPGDQISTVGAGVALQIQLSRQDDGDRYAWSADGLPPGLRIDVETGAIFGQPTTPGQYEVTVKATEVGDPDDVSSVAFKWKVE